MKIHQLQTGRIHEGDWMETELVPGYTLAIIDGPYAMGMAAWDKMKLDDLAEWYRPHLARVSELLAPSASVYLWNTAAGWARIDPVMRGLGWTFRALIVWEKTNPPSQKGTEDMRTWPEAAEYCGFYQRESLAPLGGPAQFVAYAAGESDRNEIRKWLYAERERAGLKSDALEAAVNESGGKGTMICRHSFTESQWCLPTFDQWRSLHAAWNRRGDPAGRPYLQRSERSRVWIIDVGADYDALRADYDAVRAEHEGLRADYDALRAEYEGLRAEYEGLRAPFSLPTGVSNVWTAPLVGGAERVKSDDGKPLHPCQKPLAFTERMIRASTRPGDRILSPFGGTCREAVICEWIARTTPEDARGFDCCELNQDGKDYIGPVLRQIAGEDTRPGRKEQVSLFPAPQ